jgi:O-antigen/teichoic acid export membrane protein
MLNNVLTFLNLRGAHLVIGRLLNPQALGLYTVSHEMAHLPTTELASPINRAIFPGYSKLQHDSAALGSAFLRVLGVIAMVTIPAGVGMASIAHLFVPTVLGRQWLDGIPLISILALAGTLHALQVNIESVYYAMGRPRLKAFMTLLELAVFLPALVLVVPRYGLPGVAAAVLLTVCISAPINLWLVLRILHLPIRRLLNVLWRPLIAAAVMSTTVLVAFPRTSPAPESILAGIAALAGAILTGVLSYTIVLAALWAFVRRPAGAEQWANPETDQLHWLPHAMSTC